jgi:hypothetical protein
MGITRYRETIARAIADIKGQREKSSAAPDGLAAGQPGA